MTTIDWKATKRTYNSQAGSFSFWLGFAFGETRERFSILDYAGVFALMSVRPDGRGGARLGVFQSLKAAQEAAEERCADCDMVDGEPG